HRLGLAAFDRGAVAELALVVASPAIHVARGDRARVIAAGGDGGDVRAEAQHRDGFRRARLRPVTELPVTVGAPAFERARGVGRAREVARLRRREGAGRRAEARYVRRAIRVVQRGIAELSCAIEAIALGGLVERQRALEIRSD